MGLNKLLTRIYTGNPKQMVAYRCFHQNRQISSWCDQHAETGDVGAQNILAGQARLKAIQFAYFGVAGIFEIDNELKRVRVQHRRGPEHFAYIDDTQPAYFQITTQLLRTFPG